MPINFTGDFSNFDDRDSQKTIKLNSIQGLINISNNYELTLLLKKDFSGNVALNKDAFWDSIENIKP